MITIKHSARTDIKPAREYFDNRKNEFIMVPEIKTEIPAINLELEHSLLSIAKWEGRWETQFIGKKLTREELVDYVRCMTINRQNNPDVYNFLTDEDLLNILEYIQKRFSAWRNPDDFNQNKDKDKKKDKKKDKSSKKGSDKKQDDDCQTVEAIYWAMVQYGIPFECEKWHFNRLWSLLDFFGYKGGSNPPAKGIEKKTERELLEEFAAINEANRQRFKSKG